jgi:hypothetical protein
MAELRTAHRGVAIVFFVYGGVLATWVSRIPLIKQELGLVTAQLQPGPARRPGRAHPRHARRVGPRPPLDERDGDAVGPDRRERRPGPPRPGVEPGSLAVALLLLGLSLGTLDIAMKTQGVAIERGVARPIMSGIHGMYSVGVIAGASVGALAAHFDVDPLAHFLAAAACLTALGLHGSAPLLGAEADAAAEPGTASTAEPRRVRLRHHPGLIAPGVIAFCCLFAEGAVDDWSGVYLHEVQGAALGVAPLAAGACGLGMAAGRFGGDAVIARHGRRPRSCGRR